MEGYMAHLDGIKSNPNERYRENMQAYIDAKFYGGTLNQTIYEEGVKPFDLDFSNEYEVIIDEISDMFTNVDKIVGNYKSFLYKDCKHKVYRGQYLMWGTDPYIVYEGTQDLYTVAKCKAVKCTNKIRWYDEFNVIHEYPIFLGQELTGTSKQATKTGTIPNGKLVVMIQGNEHTHRIRVNQRFIISHSMAFKVNAVDVYNMEDINNDYIPMVKLYIEYVPITPNDDLVNNIALNHDVYELDILQDSIIQVNGFEGKLNILTKLNGSSVELKYSFTSSDESVVVVDENNNYTIVGESGDEATIRCYLDGNENVFDEVKVVVQDSTIAIDEIIVNPIIESISMYNEVEFEAHLYEDNVLTSEVVSCVASGASPSSYILEEIIDFNRFKLTCLNASDVPLRLTFSSGIISKEFDISLLKFI